MLNREKAKRQAMLDSLAVQKEQRELRTHDEESLLRQQELKERIKEHQDQNRWKDEAANKVAKQEAAKAAAAEAQRQSQLGYAKTHAGTPEGQAAEYELAFPGRNPPAAAFKGAAPPAPPTAVYGWSPTTKGLEKVGEVPKGSIIKPEPAPKDTSAREATDEARKQAHRDSIHQQAITSIDKMEAPYEDQLKSLNTLGVSLAQQNNPKADALVAIEVLKSTVAGGGVRLTQPEINAELSGSRTTWDDLSLKMNKWGGDPTKPLVLTDDEKKAIRKLATALRKKTRSQIDKINKARDEVDEANTPDDINKARTALHKKLTEDEEEATAEPTAPTMTAAERVKKALGR